MVPYVFLGDVIGCDELSSRYVDRREFARQRTVVHPEPDRVLVV